MTLNEFKTLKYDYVGDGAYIGQVAQDSYVLITTNGIVIDNEVYLDDHALRAIKNFVSRSNND